MRFWRPRFSCSAVLTTGLCVTLAILVTTTLTVPSARTTSDGYFQEELHIAVEGAGKSGLEVLFVRPNDSGRYPLILINHGVPRHSENGLDSKVRYEMGPMQMWPIAIEFARRGWATAIIMRRAYGLSGGVWSESHGSCANANYISAANAGAADVRGAAIELAKRPDIDGARIVSVGVSGGGLVTVALAANPPPGLIAGISFAGGRGSLAPDQVCSPSNLVEAFRSFGRGSKIPMLWVYAENDHFFSPSLANRFKDAFVSGGGAVELVIAAAYGIDGHNLFSTPGIPQWAPIVDTFFQHHSLVLRENLLPAPDVVNIAPPLQLSENGRNQFAAFLRSAPHKVFAMSNRGYFGWRAGRRSVDGAKEGALKACKEYAKMNCDVIVVDDTSALRPSER